jgi:uncharacterized damage-inducible protein DinB
MAEIIPDITIESRKHKSLADRAIAGLSDDAFFRRPAEHVNPIALIVKHLAGNLASRWADFLTTDGEKPTRDRDSEFVLGPDDARANLMAAWERGWSILFATLAGLKDDDLEKSVTIRGEPHRVQQALLRGLNHAAYHVGQILYIARLHQPDAEYLTVPPGQSRRVRGGYLSKPPPGR